MYLINLYLEFEHVLILFKVSYIPKHVIQLYLIHKYLYIGLRILTNK